MKIWQIEHAEFSKIGGPLDGGPCLRWSTVSKHDLGSTFWHIVCGQVAGSLLSGNQQPIMFGGQRPATGGWLVTIGSSAVRRQRSAGGRLAACWRPVGQRAVGRRWIGGRAVPWRSASAVGRRLASGRSAAGDKTCSGPAAARRASVDHRVDLRTSHTA